MRYLKSHNRHHELHFPPMGSLPGITLPRDFYLPHEMANGKRSVIAVSPPQEERLAADGDFKARMKKGEYEWVETMPEDQKSDLERLAEARTEIRRLKKLAGEDVDPEPETADETEDDEEEGEEPGLNIDPNMDQSKRKSKGKKKGAT
jgi:hypothetical protein